ncbi:MAG: metallophosphoesterase [Candidatus Sumerlaeota bacterium]
MMEPPNYPGKLFRHNARMAAAGVRIRLGGSPKLRKQARAAMKALGGGLGYAAFIEPQWIETTQVTLGIRDFPASINGYKIAHLTDLHYNIAAGRNFLHRVVKKTNALDADMVALTGDFIGSDPRNLDKCMAVLSDLHAPDGCWVVRGNHDHHASLDHMRGACREAGFHLVENSHVVVRPSRRYNHRDASIERDNETSLIIAGVGDLWEGDCRPGLALKDVDPKLPVIMLSHNPHVLELLLPHQRVDLILSGHTHGGQIRPMGRHFKILCDGSTKYVSGLVQANETRVYISRGVGTSAFRLRWNCRPEIALIQLHRADGTLTATSDCGAE